MTARLRNGASSPIQYPPCLEKLQGFLFYLFAWGVKTHPDTYHSAPRGDLDKGSGNLVFLDGHTDMIKAEDQYDGGNYEIADPQLQ